jgi:RNA polymerase sigma-70 factor, ECF subfamily
MADQRGAEGQEERARRFEAIFAAAHRRVLAYALRRAEDHASAEEVVSETFLIAWRRLETAPEEPLPWLLAIARRVLANQRRSAKRRRAATGSDADSAELAHPAPASLERLAEREAFRTAFAALGERDREVLGLIAWDGLDVSEAATVMGCSAPAFSLRLHRARRRLLKELAASGHSLGEASAPSAAQDQPGISEAR